MKRALAVGFLLWLVATAALRFAPASLLPGDLPVFVLLLYAGSFAFFFFLIRRLIAPAGDAADALRAGVALFLPTLVLDALAAAFFPAAYPNFPAASAGVFGGWMLVCCGGGLAGLISRG